MIETIALVYKTGGDYNIEYVKRLVESIKKNGGSGRRIVCLSNDPAVSEYCEHIPLRHGWVGWWSKLELFENLDSCLYFDLDTVIVDDITPLLEYEHDFTMLSDFYAPEFAASGVMAWRLLFHLERILRRV